MHPEYIASTTRGLATLHPLGQTKPAAPQHGFVRNIRWNLIIDPYLGVFAFPLSQQKKARKGRCRGGAPPRSPSVSFSPALRLISGKDASLRGLKPSDILAPHRTLMELWNRFGTSLVEKSP